MVSFGLVSAIVMVLVLAAMVVTITRMREWQSYETSQKSGTLPGRFLNWLYSSPAAWMFGFLIATVLLALAGIAAVSDGAVLPVDAGTVLTYVLALLGVVLTLYVFFGTYYSIRSRGAKSSIAAVLSASLMGFLLLGAITLRLVGVV